MPDNELTRAGFGPRAAAYIFDRVLLFILLAIVRLPFAVASWFGGGELTAKSFLFNYSVLDVVGWLLISAYFALLTWSCGGTLGKLIMRLQVRREDGEPLRFIDVLYRETVGRFLSGILCIGYFMLLGDKKKRAFHDWLCGTCVVYDNIRIPEKKRAPAPDAQLWTEPGAQPQETPEPPAETARSSMGWYLPGMRTEAPAEPEAFLPDPVPETPEIPPIPATDTEGEGGA